jgi:integrase
MRRFSVYKRGKKYYVQFWNPDTKRYTTGKSTGAETRRDANMVALSWIQNGIPSNTRKRNVTETLQIDTLFHLLRTVDLTEDNAKQIVQILTDRNLISVETKSQRSQVTLHGFLTEFWNYSQSPYVREKLAYGQRIGKRHCYDMAIHVKNHWKNFFSSDKKLGDLTKEDLRIFAVYLTEKKLAPKTRNNILLAGTVALNWAYDNELIPINPGKGLRKFSSEATKRGVLTDNEVRKLFSMEWPDKRAFLGNMLAATTGLRVGEIAALQIRDIGETYLYVRHSWSEQDRLKTTKTGKDRTVPLLGSLRKQLLELAYQNPHGSKEDSFVFWSIRTPDTPVDRKLFTDKLRDMLPRLTLDENGLKDTTKLQESRKYWKSRGIVFHSWRHYYSSRLSDHLDQRSVMLATGHTTQAVFEAYASHETEQLLENVRTTTEKVFSPVVFEGEPIRQPAEYSSS